MKQYFQALWLTALVLISVFNSYSQCANPSWVANPSPQYDVGEVVSHNGKDYEVGIAGWANMAAYEPGHSNGYWSSGAWIVKNDPCLKGGGSGLSIWTGSGIGVKLNPTYESAEIGADIFMYKPTNATYWAMNSNYSYGFGIGTDNNGHIFQNVKGARPVMTFANEHVIVDQGNFTVKKSVGIGCDPVSSVGLRIKGSKPTGICIDHEVISPNNYAFKVITKHDETKAITVFNKNDKDHFSVEGSGFTQITANKTLGGDVLQLKYPNLINGRQHYMFFANRHFTGSPAEMYSTIGAYSSTPGAISPEGPEPLILQAQHQTSNLGVGFHRKAPTHKLSVQGDVLIEKSIGGPGLKILTHGSNTAAISMNSGQGYSDIYHYDNSIGNKFVSNIRFRKNGGMEFTTRLENGIPVIKNRFVVLGNGDMYLCNRVGIGATPESEVQLKVKGDKKIGLCIEHEYGSTHGYGVKSIVNSTTTRALAVVNKITNQDVFRVLGDGTVWATEVNVAVPGNFPDYVFKKDYSLMPLNVLEDYINRHSKLPNMPSATEVKKEGIGLGKLNVQLVEKIEELTLHTIEQQKLIESLGQRLLELENASNK